jgi:deoxyribodipyrimidine photolyase-related protein
MSKTLRLILGDQLNSQHSWFKQPDNTVVYALFEMRQETDYVKHHIQKVAAFFSAMRHFADELSRNGHRVVYYSINDAHNQHSLTDNLRQVITNEHITQFEYMLPDEYRLDEQLKNFCSTAGIKCNAYDTEHFLSTRDDVKLLFEHKKQILLETFYRTMRKRYNVLMNGKDPIGGKWNFDSENRKKWKGTPAAPAHNKVLNDVRDVAEEIKQAGIETLGLIDAAELPWPVTREQSLTLLEYFVTQALPYFGTYQDAMHTQHSYLFHSRLSFALNCKMIHPLEVVERVVQEWQKKPELISLPQVEGFVRQIIGWREYMRGIYWWKMPDYAKLNYFGHTRKLPHYYWNADTHMNCIKHAVQNSLNQAYAHHIQRLMVTGNFALLAGISPDEVDAWYLGIYIDAIEWVEITNTRGMSQFADGGIVGSKPYISSANYIDKMGNYCENCFYDKSKKYGDKACPFNSLYWNFYDQHRSLLKNNQRVSMMYNVWDKMSSDEKEKILMQANTYLTNLDSL